jgi:hypothetical protein
VTEFVRLIIIVSLERKRGGIRRGRGGDIIGGGIISESSVVAGEGAGGGKM